MDEKNHDQETAGQLRQGTVFLILFAILIVTGIYVKRGLGHPEFMMVFHGPAAIFLVVGGLKVTEKQRRRFKKVVID